MNDSLHLDNSFLLHGGRVMRVLRILFVFLLLPGLLVFLIGAIKNEELRIWQVYLVNLLFWSGFSQAGVAVSALLYTTNGRWGKNIRHIMEGLALFSPFAFLLFILLYVGSDIIFPWVNDPVPEKGFWLNIIHLFVRQNLNLVVINALNLTFLYYSFRPDVGLLLEKGKLKSSRLLQGLTVGWGGYEKEKERSERVLKRLSPVILFVYVVVYSMIAYDLVMSLDPHWYSTLFGAYYFMTNLYMGIAGVTIVVIIVSSALQLDGFVTRSHFHDLGLMIFVFCLITLDFFWSQYLVIWYGNIPEETSFIIGRIKTEHWFPYSLVVLASCFALPFVMLLSRNAKRNPRLLLPVACLVFAGVWMERFLLVVPTLWHGDVPPLGFPEFAITLTFLSGFALVYLAFMERLPILPCDADRG